VVRGVQVLAGKLGDRHITVNALAPGPFQVSHTHTPHLYTIPRSAPVPTLAPPNKHTWPRQEGD
jgi:NAD(P)-dependent dehydrogenase (short-subunit alcohol dehydrogenase family)